MQLVQQYEQSKGNMIRVTSLFGGFGDFWKRSVYMLDSSSGLSILR